MPITLSRWWLGVLLLVPVVAFPVTLKIATVVPDGTIWMEEMRAAGKTIDTLTAGRVKMKFYPGGVMGSANTVRRKMRVGQLQGGAFTSGELAELYHDMFLYNIPFLFRDEIEVNWVRKRLDPLIVKGMQKRGLTILAISGGGFAYALSDHPVNSLAALARSKVWTPEGDAVSREAFRLAGVSPIPLPLPDVYTQLQTGAIDTVMNTPTGTIAFQWHTKMRYMADYPLIYVTGIMAVDNSAFDKISAEDQMIVRETFGDAFARVDKATVRDNVEAREALANQGIEILPIAPEEVDSWRKIGRDLLVNLQQSQQLKFEHLDDLIHFVGEYRQLQKQTAGNP